MIKPGDIVSVLDNDLRGKVIKLEASRGVALVEDQHGFVHEAALSEIVPVVEDIYGRIDPTEKISMDIGKKAKLRTGQRDRYLIDLHAEAVGVAKAASPFERLFAQKHYLETELEAAFRTKIKKIEIVHGIGDGVLQKMVEDYLTEKNYEYHHNAVLKHQSGSITVFRNQVANNL